MSKIYSNSPTEVPATKKLGKKIIGAGEKQIRHDRRFYGHLIRRKKRV